MHLERGATLFLWMKGYWSRWSSADQAKGICWLPTVIRALPWLSSCLSCAITVFLVFFYKKYYILSHLRPDNLKAKMSEIYFNKTGKSCVKQWLNHAHVCAVSLYFKIFPWHLRGQMYTSLPKWDINVHLNKHLCYHLLNGCQIQWFLVFFSLLWPPKYQITFLIVNTIR